jgi:hypothetical protein
MDKPKEFKSIVACAKCQKELKKGFNKDGSVPVRRKTSSFP